MNRAFPIPFRLLAAACAFLVLAVTGPVAAAQDPPTSEEVEAAEAAADALEAELRGLEAELAAVEAGFGEAAFEVDRQEGLLEEVIVDLTATRERIGETAARYERLRERLNERAAEAFMGGPGSSLGFVLDASSLSDLSDRLEFVDAVSSADATLAQEVASLSYALSLDEEALSELKAERVRTTAEAEAEAAQLHADLERAQQLRDEIATKAANALATSVRLDEEREAYLKELAEQQPPLPPQGGGKPLPTGWEDVLEVCPVGTPRAFGDGFGAPRYIGGFHPHAGVDIVAPEGTPVVATFAGTAVDATNSLGGTSVQVYGEYGYTYNAHLSSIAALGPVQAGDVIGYVSSSGLAGGVTPHNHFEFHPNVVPTGWPVSYYGYSVIGNAVNPYPLLVAACY